MKIKRQYYKINGENILSAQLLLDFSVELLYVFTNVINKFS
jgi:hypothetical protein